MEDLLFCTLVFQKMLFNNYNIVIEFFGFSIFFLVVINCPEKNMNTSQPIMLGIADYDNISSITYFAFGSDCIMP